PFRKSLPHLSSLLPGPKLSTPPACWEGGVGFPRGNVDPADEGGAPRRDFFPLTKKDGKEQSVLNPACGRSTGGTTPMPLTEKNADGKPAVGLTDEQRYILDLKGWIAIPSVLSDSDVGEMREFCYRLHRDRESVPLHERSSVGGPLQKLTDHPIILGF